MSARIEYWVAVLMYGQVCRMADAAFTGSGSPKSGKVNAAGGKILTYPSRRKSDEEVSAAFDAYGNSILRLAYSYLHSMEDAEDILQDTIIRFMDRAPLFENESTSAPGCSGSLQIFQRTGSTTTRPDRQMS